MNRIPRDVLHYTPLGATSPGGRSTLGEPPSARSYQVRRGDTFSGIAHTLGVTPEQLIEANPRAPRIQHLGRTLLDLEERQVLRVPSTVGVPIGESCGPGIGICDDGLWCMVITSGENIGETRCATNGAKNVPAGGACAFNYDCADGRQCSGGVCGGAQTGGAKEAACGASGGTWNGSTCVCPPPFSWNGDFCTGGDQGTPPGPDQGTPPGGTTPPNDCDPGQTYDPAGPGGHCFTCDAPGTQYNLSTHDCKCKPGLVWNDAAGACLTKPSGGSGGGGTKPKPPAPKPDTTKPNTPPAAAPQTKSNVGTIVAVGAVGAAAAGLAIYLATRKKSSR
jgi:hypothetical protein